MTQNSIRFRILTLITLFCFVGAQNLALAEAMSETYSSITPNQGGGGGEYIHGQKSGKLLVRVLVFGAVPVQGIHFVPEGTDLLFAILYSGGYTDSSKLAGITIRRRGMKDLMRVDMESIIANGDPVPKLLDGDIITVPYNWRKDIATISLLTSFVSSMTGFTLSIIALIKSSN